MADVRPCGIADAMEVIGERWALLIVRELLWGNHRFGGIVERTGAPTDVTSARLKRLVEAGLVERRPYSERPPRSEYHLTPAGRALRPVLLAIDEWATAHRPRGPSEPAARHLPHGDHEALPVSHFTCGVCGEPLAA